MHLPITLPPWLSPKGLRDHLIAGAAISAFFFFLGLILHCDFAVPNLFTVGFVGVAHEVGDGDFKSINNGPLNGIVNALAFLPAPIVYILLS